MQPSFKNLKSFMVLSALATMMSACATLPNGRDQLNLVSDDAVNKTGTFDFEVLKRSRPHSLNPSEISYVTCVVDALTKSIDPSLKWEVAVFEGAEPNAFAFAGGKIGLNSGLFRAALNSDQLAVALSHEIAHVVLHHARERMSEQMAVDTLDGLSHLPGLSKLDVVSGVAQMGTLYVTSQAQEFEADVTGLDLLARSGFDPDEALSFWQNMQVYGLSEHMISGHASTDRRIINLKQHLPNAKKLASTAQTRPNCQPPELAARPAIVETISAETVSPDEPSDLKPPPIIGSAGDVVTLRGGLHIAKTAYSIWGLGVGSVLGLGLGHAVQGHYLEDGWKWSLIDVGLIVGIVASQECSSNTTSGMVNGVYTVSRVTNCNYTSTSKAALFGLIGSHIWQAVELWRQPKKLIQMASRPAKSGIHFQQPLLLASDDSVTFGGIWNW
jgi:Zn-dependent protease with chaperone function